MLIDLAVFRRGFLGKCCREKPESEGGGLVGF